MDESQATSPPAPVREPVHGFSSDFLEQLRCQAMTKEGTQCTLYVPCRWHHKRQPYTPPSHLPDFRTLEGRHRFRERLTRALLADQLTPPVVAVAIKILDSAMQDEAFARQSANGARPITVRTVDYRALEERHE
jgi:hypothetical protein